MELNRERNPHLRCFVEQVPLPVRIEGGVNIVVGQRCTVLGVRVNLKRRGFCVFWRLSVLLRGVTHMSALVFSIVVGVEGRRFLIGERSPLRQTSRIALHLRILLVLLLLHFEQLLQRLKTIEMLHQVTRILEIAARTVPALRCTAYLVFFEVLV